MKLLRFFTPLVFAIALAGCHKHHDTAPAVASDPTPQPGSTLIVEQSAPVVSPIGITGPADGPVTGADDDSILATVIANGDSEDTVRSLRGDRAIVFGDNYPGTPAELHECVNDAKKNVLNLVRFEHFDPKNIRLFLNEKCTKANYEKWGRWIVKDANAGDRRAFFNSSHGAEDTDAAGNTVDVIVTYDMVIKNQWDETTEVSPEFWSTTLRTTTCNFLILNDACHSGGDMRAVLGALSKAKRRSIRSIEGPQVVRNRVDASLKKIGQRQQLSALTGTIVPACQASELSEEASGFGGAGTECYWRARKSLPVEAKVGDIIREANRLLKENQFSQHMGLIGVNKPIWSTE